MSRAEIRVLELRSVRGTGGGPEKTILLGAARSSPGFKIVVCYVRDVRDPVFGIHNRAAALNVEYTEVLERHSLDLRVWPALRALVRDARIDIVHSHDYKTDLLAHLLERFEGVIAMATAHGWTGHTKRERFGYYPLDKWLLSRFRRVVAVSDAIRNELLRFGANPNSVNVVLNGIDSEAFRPEPSRRNIERQRLALPHDAFVIGAVGRLEPQKRFDILIDVFARLRRTHANLHLLIAGGGSLEQALQAQIAHSGLEASCRLLGHFDDVKPIYHAIDLFVQSSKYEGTSNAVLEAMALGTPIVATDVGGTAQQIQHGIHGLIVPACDAVALQAAVERVINDRPGAARRAEAARARTEGALSFLSRIKRIEEIYSELAQSTGESRNSAGARMASPKAIP